MQYIHNSNNSAATAFSVYVKKAGSIFNNMESSFLVYKINYKLCSVLKLLVIS